MQKDKKVHAPIKTKLHARNKHRSRYDFGVLTKTLPDLEAFVMTNKYDDVSIDFFNPQAVKMLNKALLLHYYDIENWDIPDSYLCPPIPGRADYIHHIADLLSDANKGKIPTGNAITCLDIGVGANCIYPIIGTYEYGWSFIASDIDSHACANTKQIIDSNKRLTNLIDLRRQEHPTSIYKDIIKSGEYVDVSICNPPFHSSRAEAEAGSVRKNNNLRNHNASQGLNFGGKSNELWCEGGELKLIKTMIQESTLYATSCFWFSTLVSKKSHLKAIYSNLQKANAADIKTIEMGQGNKSSRFIAWSFLSEKQRKVWVNARWNK